MRYVGTANQHRVAIDDCVSPVPLPVRTGDGKPLQFAVSYFYRWTSRRFGSDHESRTDLIKRDDNVVTVDLCIANERAAVNQISLAIDLSQSP